MACTAGSASKADRRVGVGRGVEEVEGAAGLVVVIDAVGAARSVGAELAVQPPPSPPATSAATHATIPSP